MPQCSHSAPSLRRSLGDSKAVTIPQQGQMSDHLFGIYQPFANAFGLESMLPPSQATRNERVWYKRKQSHRLIVFRL